MFILEFDKRVRFLSFISSFSFGIMVSLDGYDGILPTPRQLKSETGKEMGGWKTRKMLDGSQRKRDRNQEISSMCIITQFWPRLW